jgi:hypothetical protein
METKIGFIFRIEKEAYLIIEKIEVRRFSMA